MRRGLNTDADGCCKCIYARMGRLSWENFLGRLEHGGWDSQMTCILEYTYEEDSDKHDRGRDMPDDSLDLPQGGDVQRV